MSRTSPTWAIQARAQIAEIEALDVPYMLDKLTEMQEFINHAQPKLEEMQRRREWFRKYLADLEEQT